MLVWVVIKLTRGAELEQRSLGLGFLENIAGQCVRIGKEEEDTRKTNTNATVKSHIITYS